ncbi:cellulose biosynthesis cyclic di-GMP-binding regulatory protein BcsB [Calothrix sp. NIES-3974]|uniref:cellulose biosynthesis cyclic di-GMP-binding regulatory protein BcsB n=1 Tax=Calothrix sp. NIES-3974 TaxID=2005462 RepID=UPI000B5E6B3C|nr:cellulose biosynthesis cyclic di-GMP-binding regulatory protein BcsB [Calothrix sp. NIES-3974]BAZ03654.1 hypothetical protein NIES3974_02830 [Calothrix sp. NIES-3974]
MKQLLFISKVSKQAILITFCCFLFPHSLPARAINQTGSPLLLAQATRSNQRNNTNEETDSQTPKNLVTYELQFNRSPIVGNSLRLRGSYAETRVAFTRPRGWDLKNGTVQALVRFQHSPSLFANRSNLTFLVNGRSVGSVQLNRKASQIGQHLVNIPTSILNDYNDLTIVAQQHNSQECTDPSSPDLWTEILPDSRIVFKYQRQPIPLNFSRYPYPVFDDLGLEANRLVYLQPTQANQSWLTSAARFQASIGRTAEFRPVETGMISSIDDVKENERLIIIGTPSEQPALATMKDLPLKIAGGRVLNASQQPVPQDHGVLMLTTSKPDGGVPVLIVTGNSPKAVENAVQFLAKPDARKMGTGQVVIVDNVADVATPGVRQWPRHLPEQNQFRLSDLRTAVNGEPFNDITVRGAGAPAVEIDFRALPDDRFLRGSSMNLVYSYGPQLNPRTSAVQVFLDDNFIGGARLTNESGEREKNLKVDLPPNLIKPDSKIRVFFRMNAREVFDRQRCVQPPDQQLTGTVHASTNFDLKRETSAQIPDLGLLKFGYPFAAPQDLSRTAVVLPQNPSVVDILTLLEFSERLGRLSEADGIKLSVYFPDGLTNSIRSNDHLVAIGTYGKFPLPEVFKSPGFNLGQAFTRQSANARVQTPQDAQGMMKQVVSPWNNQRVLLALTAQTDTGLDKVRQILNLDPWFFQLKQDTVLISSDKKNPVPYDPDAYQLAFFQEAPSTSRVENTTPLSKASRMIQQNWLLLPAGLVGVSLLLYGIVQLYLQRLSPNERK